jgi:hypothetical protein
LALYRGALSFPPEGGVELDKTVPGQGYVLSLRLYGATVPFYDQSWIPG